LGGAFAVLQLAVDQELGLHGIVLFEAIVVLCGKRSPCRRGLASEDVITGNVDVG
jgi:hypothetical protein